MFDITNMASSLGGIPWMLCSFVVALSIIVAVHEYGHYIVGRWSGIHAEVFSIGFGPVLIAKQDRRGTIWQIAAVPFGGYVKFKGDTDAASSPDTEMTTSMSVAERRSTMFGAPLWARAATAAAGPVFNFVFSTLVFAMVFVFQGKPSDGLVIAELSALPVSHELQVGDEVLAINGTRVAEKNDFFSIAIPTDFAGTISYEIRRGDNVIDVDGPAPVPPLVVGVTPQSAAYAAGVKAGDVVLQIDGQNVHDFNMLQSLVAEASDSEMMLTMWRDGQVFETALVAKETAMPDPAGGYINRRLIGVRSGVFFETANIPVGIFEAVPAAARRTGYIIESSLSGMWHMAIGNISTCNISGPIGIAEVSGQMASMGLVPFLMLLAGLSTMIGMMNLLPIPVLDGGHLVFHAYEAVVGRPPSDRAIQILMSVGLSIVLSFMVFALTTDLFCP